MNNYVKTIKNSFSVEGVGIHNGLYSKVTLIPSNSGEIKFFYNNVSLKLSIENIPTLENNTTIISGEGISITTIEHLLSALFAYEITSCDILLEGGDEIPILDSSAKYWVENLNFAGAKPTDKLQKIYTVNHPIEFTNNDSKYTIRPANTLIVSCTIDFPSVVIGNQNLVYRHSLSNYCNEISMARSFLKDMAQGNKVDRGTLNQRLKGYNIDDLNDPILILYSEDRYITPLRIENEPVRHKLLDFLGDLFTTGMIIYGELEIYKPGHNSNIAFAKYISNYLKPL